MLRLKVCLCSMLLLILSSVSYAENKNGTITRSDDYGTLEVVDLAGRPLRFTKVPQRIILGESRYLAALSILDQEDPLKRIVGMLADLKEVDYGTYQQYKKKFPHIDDVALVGHTSAESFSVEKVLSLQADLAIFGVDGHGPTSHHAQLISQLQQAGTQVVFIDFRNNPIVNSIKSIDILGKVLGREKRAQEFISFYQQQLNEISIRLSTLDSSTVEPRVFLHSRVGLQNLCCETMARGMMASFIDEARGNNIATSIVPGHAGIMNVEYLLTEQPDVYIATAIGSANPDEKEGEKFSPYIMLGAGVNREMAHNSLTRAISQGNVRELNAIHNENAHAIWHNFYNTPLNIVAVQVFSKWLYPEKFSDLDPENTLKVLYERFQSIPLEGTYWVSLQDGK